MEISSQRRNAWWLRGERITDAVERREQYRERERYEQLTQASATLDEFVALEEKLSATPAVRREDVNAWQRCATQREVVAKELENVAARRDAMEANSVGARQKQERLEARSERARARVTEITARLSPQVDAYQHRRSLYRRTETQSSLMRGALWVSTGILVTAITAFLFTGFTVAGVIGVVAAVAVAACALSQRRAATERGALLAMADKLVADATALGVAVDSVNDLGAAIADIEREAVAAGEEAAAQKGTVQAMTEALAHIDHATASLRERDADLATAEAKYQTETRCKTVSDAQAVSDARTNLTHRIEATRVLFLRQVPIAVERTADAKRWRQAVDAAIAEMDPSEHGEFDPDELVRLDNDIRRLRDVESDAEAEIKKAELDLHGVLVRVGELGVLEEIPPCRTLADLAHLGASLEGWMRHIEDKANAARVAVRIFQDIEEQDRQRVSDLFGASSRVTSLFREITDGRYTNVTYDAGQDRIFVDRVDGLSVRADALSGGAFDQLYLAVRLSIAESMFPESKGFFVMDDPFIKSDRNRLAAVLGVLRRFVDRGWQILYFSAKDEVVDALSTDIQSGDCQLIQLDGPLFTPKKRSHDGELFPVSPRELARDSSEPRQTREAPQPARPAVDDRQGTMDL